MKLQDESMKRIHIVVICLQLLTKPWQILDFYF